MNDRISSRQLCAAVFTAMCIPAFTLCVRLPWNWVLLAVLAAGLYYYIMYRLMRGLQNRQGLLLLLRGAFGAPAARLLCLLLALIALALGGYAAVKSAAAFPETRDTWSVGLLVLILAAVAAYAGLSAVVRCGSILFLVLAAVFGAILVFSAPEVKLRWLAPQSASVNSPLVLAVLLLPVVALCFFDRVSERNTRAGGWVLAGGAVVVAASLLTAGCLSPALAAKADSFYTLAGSVSVFGIMERAETFLSAAYLSGTFVLCALLLCAAQFLVKAAVPTLQGKTLAVLCAVLAAAGMLLGGCSAALVLAAGGVFCGILALATLAVARLKKL